MGTGTDGQPRGGLVAVQRRRRRTGCAPCPTTSNVSSSDPSGWGGGASRWSGPGGGARAVKHENNRAMQSKQRRAESWDSGAWGGTRPRGVFRGSKGWGLSPTPYPNPWGRRIGQSATRVPGGVAGYIPHNDPNDALIILSIHKWGKENFQKKIAHKLRLPSAKGPTRRSGRGQSVFFFSCFSPIFEFSTKF